MKDKNLPEYMTKGGPGDNSTPGNVNTDEWWKHLSETSQINANKKNSIASLAKNKDIWFCTIPFTQIYSELDGRYQACCFGAPSNNHTIEDTSLKDWMVKSNYMNDLRREMTTVGSDLKMTKQHCNRCRDDEERYGRSRRTNCLKIHTNDTNFWENIESNITRFQKTGEYTFNERICEIQLKIFGSECNLDCYMCLHANSTTRLKVASEGVWNRNVLGPVDDYLINSFKKVMKDKTNGVIEQVIALAPYTRSIKIIGGEPLIMKKHYEMLDALIETGHSKEIIIKYQTNLTKTKAGKHNFFKYVPYFKLFTIVASVDGIGPVIEYMRRRTNWNEVIENINLCNQHPNAVVDFNGLVSFLSVLRFYEVIEWCKQNPVIDQLNWAMVENPKHFRPNNLPKKLKEQLIPKYKDWPDIIAVLERDADTDVDIQDVFAYLLKQDAYYKGTKWEANLFDVFPELKEFYDPNRKPKPEDDWKISQIEKELKILRSELKNII